MAEEVKAVDGLITIPRAFGRAEQRITRERETITGKPQKPVTGQAALAAEQAAGGHFKINTFIEAALDNIPDRFRHLFQIG